MAYRLPTNLEPLTNQPVTDVNYVKGAPMIVASAANLTDSTIPQQRRMEGMEVIVISPLSKYRLGSDLVSWTEIVSESILDASRNIASSTVRDSTFGILDATQTAAKRTRVTLTTLGGLGGSTKKGRFEFGHYLNEDGFVNASGSENAKWRGLRLSINSGSFSGGGNDDSTSTNSEFVMENEFASTQIPIFSVAWNAGTSATRVTFGAPSWGAGNNYAEDDCRQQGGNTYRCKTAHFSGTFATDLASGKWVLLFSGAGTANLISTSGMMPGFPLCMKGFTGAGATLLNKLNSKQLKTKTIHGVNDGYIDLDLDTSGDNYSGLDTTSAKLWSVGSEYWYGCNSVRPSFMAFDVRAGATTGLWNVQIPLSISLPATFAGNANNYVAVFQTAKAFANGTHVLIQNTANLGQSTLTMDGGQDGVDRSTWIQATNNQDATADYVFYQLRPKFIPNVLKFKDGGNVGIGVSAPTAKLEVATASSSWSSPTAYTEGQTVKEGASTYYCLVGHTSGTFATDLAAGKWGLLYTHSLKVAGYAAIDANVNTPALAISNAANLALRLTSTNTVPQYNIVAGASNSTLYSLFQGYVTTGGGDRLGVSFGYFTGDGGDGTVGTVANLETSADAFDLIWGSGAGGSATRTLSFGTTSITLPAVITQIVAPAAELQLTGSLAITGTVRSDGALRLASFATDPVSPAAAGWAYFYTDSSALNGKRIRYHNGTLWKSVAVQDDDGSLQARYLREATTDGLTIVNEPINKLSFWGASPAVQPTAVADATDAPSVIAQLNALLARLRTIGIIAT